MSTISRATSLSGWNTMFTWLSYDVLRIIMASMTRFIPPKRRNGGVKSEVELNPHVIFRLVSKELALLITTPPERLLETRFRPSKDPRNDDHAMLWTVRQLPMSIFANAQMLGAYVWVCAPPCRARAHPCVPPTHHRPPARLYRRRATKHGAGQPFYATFPTPIAAAILPTSAFCTGYCPIHELNTLRPSTKFYAAPDSSSSSRRRITHSFMDSCSCSSAYSHAIVVFVLTWCSVTGGIRLEWIPHLTPPNLFRLSIPLPRGRSRSRQRP